jgi:hypothetical protein
MNINNLNKSKNIVHRMLPHPNNIRNLGTYNKRVIIDFLRKKADIDSDNPNDNKFKKYLAEDINIRLTSDDTLGLIGSGNQAVRDSLTQHRSTELNEYNLHHCMMLHDDNFNPHIPTLVQMINDNTKQLGHLEMRKLLDVIPHDNGIIVHLNNNRETELVNLVNSNTMLEDHHIDNLLYIDNENTNLAFASNQNRVLTKSNIDLLLDNEVVCHQLLQSRQSELTQNPCFIAELANNDDINFRDALLSSNLPIRQTVLNGIFEEGVPDDIQSLIHSKRLDNQLAIEPNPEHDSNFNNGNLITDRMIQDYINQNDMSDENRDTLQQEFNQMQHRRGRQHFNQQRNVRQRRV